jgi:hypothetical protein
MHGVTELKAAHKRRSEFDMRREKWQQQILQDRELWASSFKAGIAISHCLNRDKFETSGLLVAWPGIKWLADRTAMTHRSMQRAIRQLKARGHLHIDEGGQGQGRSHHYEVVLKSGRGALRLV